jgi:polyisoprenoid-binding protein YceI
MRRLNYVALFVLVETALVSASMAISKTQTGWNAKLDKGEVAISFEAVGQPSFLKVHGKSERGLRGTLENKGDSVSGFGVFSLESLETGIDLRDQHMKNKYLEVNKYPVTKLTLDPIPLHKATAEIPFHGTLELHGQKKPIGGTVTLNPDNSKLRANFSFTLKLSDFHIEPPSFAKITIQDAIKISVVGTFPIQVAER